MTVLVLAALSACKKDNSNDPQTSATDWDCDPIAPTVCGMPVPSTYFMKADDDTATGFRMNLGETTMPATIDGYQPSPHLFNEQHDGWSPLSPIVTHIPGVSLDGVAGHDDIGASLADDSKTIIVDADTGQRVPHFVEKDVFGADPDSHALVLRPVVPMSWGGRYVVGLRGLTLEDGSPVEPSEAFAALRDGTDSDDERVESRRSTYEATVFSALDSAGWNRDEVQLAWDFVVASEDNVRGRLLSMRDDALDRVGDEGPAYTIETVEQWGDSEDVAWLIRGKMTVPYYTETDAPGTLLTRDDDGKPYYNGDTVRDFSVLIPQTLVDDPRPAPIVQYGHGFFWRQKEIEHSEWLHEMANRHGWVVAAVDLTGMAEPDEDAVKLMLVSGIDEFAILPERTHQGVVEHVMLSQLLTGAFTDDPNVNLVHPKTKETVGILDPERIYWYGISQGGIMGTAITAVSPHITRSVLQVSGAPYTTLMTRSTNFEPFFQLMETFWPNPEDISYYLGLIQTPFDTTDAAGWLTALDGTDPVPGVPAKQVLMQIAIGDAQVTTLGAHIQARGIGADLIGEPTRQVWGLDTAPSGHTGNGIVEWDFGIPEVPFEAVPPEDEWDVHGKVRKDENAQDQIAHFFDAGEIVDFCKGPCLGSLD